MSNVTSLRPDDLDRILADLERVLDDEAAPQAEHLRAAVEVFRQRELLQIEFKISELLGELARRAGGRLTLVPPAAPPPDETCA